MTRKTKLMIENISLKVRIAELEEKICPCEQHNYIKVDYEFVGGTGIKNDRNGTTVVDIS